MSEYLFELGKRVTKGGTRAIPAAPDAGNCTTYGHATLEFVGSKNQPAWVCLRCKARIELNARRGYKIGRQGGA